MKKLSLITFLKGYSIFTIVIFHCLQNIKLPGTAEKAIYFGGTGVHLFILISGLGLYLSYLNKPISYINFIKKRLTKIYLPYILVVLLTALIFTGLPIHKNSLYALGGHVFLYKMFDNTIISSYGLQLWFISTIIQFYFAFHLIVKLRSLLSWNTFIVLGVVISVLWSLLVISLGYTNSRAWNSFFLQYIWEFILGMAIAERIYSNNLQYKFKNIYYLFIGLFGVALYGVLALKGGTVGKMMNDIPALIGYSSLAIFIYRLDVKIINRFFIFTGDISFAWYLIHVLVLWVSKYVIEHFGYNFSIFSVILVICLSYVLSIIYNKFIGILFAIGDKKEFTKPYKA